MNSECKMKLSEAVRRGAGMVKGKNKKTYFDNSFYYGNTNNISDCYACMLGAAAIGITGAIEVNELLGKSIVDILKDNIDFDSVIVSKYIGINDNSSLTLFEIADMLEQEGF